MARFTGKKIVITGASSGIGLVGAKRIVAEEGEVMITGRDAYKLAHLHKVLPPGCCKTTEPSRQRRKRWLKR